MADLCSSGEWCLGGKLWILVLEEHLNPLVWSVEPEESLKLLFLGAVAAQRRAVCRLWGHGQALLGEAVVVLLVVLF